jgi:Prokaryotic E2 family E
MLPSVDAAFLDGKSLKHEVIVEAGTICVIIPGLRLPSGLSATETDLLLRLAPGYPDVPPDMWWFSPAIRRRDGTVIPATDAMETHLGRNWQRWSRHLDAARWMSGVDSLESYFALITSELEKAARVAA